VYQILKRRYLRFRVYESQKSPSWQELLNIIQDWRESYCFMWKAKSTRDISKQIKELYGYSLSQRWL